MGRAPVDDSWGFLAAIAIACFCTGNIVVKVMASSSLLAFLINGLLALHVIMFVGKP
jgi:hypothetical protein